MILNDRRQVTIEPDFARRATKVTCKSLDYQVEVQLYVSALEMMGFDGALWHYIVRACRAVQAHVEAIEAGQRKDEGDTP